jgi:cytochrome c oxidase cbb3-type subunit 3
MGIARGRNGSTGIGTSFLATRVSLSCLRPRSLGKSGGESLKIIIALSWILVSSLPGEENSRTTSHDSTSYPARHLFASNCAACHGLDGRGGERAPDIATRREVQRLSDAALLRVIEAGVPGTGMPGFRSLGNAKIRAIMRHLRSLQGRQSKIVVAGNPQSGEALFFGTAGCAQCHMINGVGGFIGSDLTNYAQTQSANEIREVITRPDQYLGSRARLTTVTTRDGRQYEGIVRNDDNFSLQVQSQDGAFHLFMKSEVQRIEQQGKSLMPTDYGSRLSTQQLDDLSSYLISLRARDHSHDLGERHQPDANGRRHLQHFTGRP